jgi:hypothetical protein
VPQWADPRDEFTDHVGRQARDPTVADEHCASCIPHHMTMINDQELDVSPPTMHELDSLVLCLQPLSWKQRGLGSPLAPRFITCELAPQHAAQASLTSSEGLSTSDPRQRTQRRPLPRS